MGRLAKLMSFVRFDRNGSKGSEVKIDTGGGQIVTAPYLASPGDDAQPLPADFVAAEELPGSGKFAAVAYADPVNAGVAEPGEKRIYGRDGNGVLVNQVHLLADGTVLISNDAASTTLSADGTVETTNGTGSIKLLPDGSVNINGAIISPVGEITNAAGIVLGTHVHLITWTDPAGSAPSAPPTP